jgi:large subunit ribosomal protein L10
MRPEKASIVSELSERLSRSPFMLVTNYQRMKVDQFGELRNRLAPAHAEVRVVKNSFLKRAMADSGFPDVGKELTGQTAIVMGESDVAPVAKILKAFAAEFKIATLKIGVIDRAILSKSDVEALADLPSREVLLSQLLGLLLMPATALVRLLNEPAASLARVLKAKADQGEAQAPPREEKSPDAPAPVAASAPEVAVAASVPDEAVAASAVEPVAASAAEEPIAENAPEASAADQTPMDTEEPGTAEVTKQ